MNKAELVDRISESTGVSKADVETVITGMFEVVADHVSRTEDKVSLPGWISFQQTTRAPRVGRNPRTGETMDIPATKSVKVTAGSKLKAAAKGG